MPPDYIAQSAHSQLLHRRLTGQILGAFYSVYRELGGGFAENVYEGALARELARLGLKADCQVPIVVHYRNRPVGTFRADMLVEGLILLELKARSALFPVHEAQLLNFLRATPIEVGLLLNFGPRPEFKRLVYREQS